MIAVVRGANTASEVGRNDHLDTLKASIGSWLITAALSLSLVIVALGEPQTTGALTATAARQATDRASSYATCRQVFGQTATAEQSPNR